MLSPLERRRFRVRWVASTAHRHGRLRLLGRPRQRAPRSWRIAARRWPHRSESSSLPPGHPRAVARTVTEPNSKPELGRQRQRHALRKLRPSQRRLRARETRQALVHPPRRRGVHADARAMAQQPRVHRVHAGGPPRVIASVVRCTTGGHPAAGPECTVIRQREVEASCLRRLYTFRLKRASHRRGQSADCCDQHTPSQGPRAAGGRAYLRGFFPPILRRSARLPGLGLEPHSASRRPLSAALSSRTYGVLASAFA